jgi:D-glycero-D-manno-heptose 1,7-bisphosphate phosphatase
VSHAAVFLDRDGVINRNWYNPATGEWESPLRPEDFELFDGVIASLTRLAGAGFRLFLVSNQPSAAKGKCTLDDLHRVQGRLAELLDSAGVSFDGFYYSYTHPQGVVPGLTGHFPGRKPSPYFLEQAIARFELVPRRCWMVGDRHTDIECGRRAGVRTIKVRSTEGKSEISSEKPDFYAEDLAAATAIILAPAVASSPSSL